MCVGYLIQFGAKPLRAEIQLIAVCTNSRSKVTQRHSAPTVFHQAVAPLPTIMYMYAF